MIDLLKRSICVLGILTAIACDRKLPDTFPSDRWEVAAPEAVHVHSKTLKKALDYLKQHCKKDGLHETLIVKDGYVIFKGDSVHKKHNIYSCSKSFTSTVLGLMQNEHILSLDDKIADIDTMYRALYPEVTFRHFTTMTSGYNAVGQTRWPGEISEDWSLTPYEPTTPLFSPGTAYAYWDEAMMVFGKLLTMRSEKDLKTYLDERVMHPIGVNDWDWWYETTYHGIPIRNGCTGIAINALDFARIGHLFLHKGNWEGKQLIPEDWIEEATKNQVAETLPIAETDRKNVKGSGRYGYNWWVIQKGQESPVAAYYASGLNHNVCLVIPQWNMVVIRMGDDGNPEAGKHVVYTELLKIMAKSIMK